MRGANSSGVTSLAVARFIEVHRQFIEDQGFTVETSTDAAKMAEFSKSFKDKPSVSEPFSLKKVDLLRDNCLWLYGRSKKGKPVYIHALAIDDLGSSCLGDWFRQRYGRILKHSVGEAHCPPAFRITGRVVYQGELFVRKSARNKGISSAVARLLQAIAYVHWDKPDYFYAFAARNNIYTGLVARQGYINYAPSGVDWGNSKPLFDQDDWLVYMSRSDHEWYFSQSPEMYF